MAREQAPIAATVKGLAKAKGLPLELLREAGVKDVEGGVLIPYVEVDGSRARGRIRTAIAAKDGSRWRGTSGAIVPYGLARSEQIRRRGFVFLVEGESDVWTLWNDQLPGLGIPGASMTATLQKEHLPAVKQVFIVQEPDKAGAAFVLGMAERLQEIDWQGDARVVDLGMDINDLHLKDSGSFLDTLRAACNASASIEHASGETSAASADVSMLPWDEPVPLGPPDPPPIPLTGLPGWLQAHVISVAEATQTPTDLSLLLGLSGLSTALANVVKIQVRRGHEEPVILWTTVVLPPGARKSPVFSKMTAPLREWERERAVALLPQRKRALDRLEVLEQSLKKAIRRAAGPGDRDAGMGDVETVRSQIEKHEVPPPPRLIASDITPERLAQLMAENHGRLAILAAEGDIFKIMAGRYQGGRANFDNYKSGWTGDEAIRDDRIGREGTYVRRPAITFGLAVQPSVFETLQHRDEFRGEGLLARFLYAIPDDQVGRRLTGEALPPTDEKAEQDYDCRLRSLLEVGPASTTDDGEWVSHLLTLSDGARRALFDFEAAVEEALGPSGQLHEIADWGSKLPGNVTRLAGLLHVAEQGGAPWSDVSSDAMQAAVRIGNALIPHALKLFDLVEADPDTELAAYVLDRVCAIGDLEKLTKRDLFNRCRRKSGLSKVRDLDRVLKILEEHDFLRTVKQPSSGGQPPSPRVLLNPSLTRNARRSRRSGETGAKRRTSATSVSVQGHSTSSVDPPSWGVDHAPPTLELFEI